MENVSVGPKQAHQRSSIFDRKLLRIPSTAHTITSNFRCGANHGGFQNCCANSTACPSCKVQEGKTPEELLTEACLKECPPKDDIDKACAYHDACTFSYPGPKKLKCVPQGNLCACDCLLVQQVKDVKVCQRITMAFVMPRAFVWKCATGAREGGDVFAYYACLANEATVHIRALVSGVKAYTVQS